MPDIVFSGSPLPIWTESRNHGPRRLWWVRQVRLMQETLEISWNITRTGRELNKALSAFTFYLRYNAALQPGPDLCILRASLQHLQRAYSTQTRRQKVSQADDTRGQWQRNYDMFAYSSIPLLWKHWIWDYRESWKLCERKKHSAT